MSLHDTIYALSNINALLGSTVGFVNDRQNGMPTNYAFFNMSNNIMNGAMRNAVSDEIFHNSGSYLGFAVNNAAGYGSPEANYYGTIGTMNAAMISAFFNPYGCCHNGITTSSLYGCGPFGGGYGRFFPGCNTGFMFGGPSFFGMRGYLC